MFHYVSCGLKNVYLRNGYTVKETPYGKATSIQDVEGLHKAIGLYLVKNKPQLSGSEVRFLRRELDISQKALADLLGVGDTSVRNWESGRGKITGPADRMLRVLYQQYVKGPTEIRSMVEHINELDRQITKKVEFVETDRGWRPAA